MLHIIGQYDCKADAKGRVTLPVSLKSQLLPILEKGFVIKRSVFQNCLELYPKEAYDELMEKILKKNRFCIAGFANKVLHKGFIKGPFRNCHHDR